ncbi:MAG: LysM peptidoglycan-binding domain-containing protein [Chloroflexota bacterium]
MRLTRLNLFAVLFVLGGVFSVSTASVIRWASVAHESARLAAIVAMPIPATVPAAIALTPSPDLFPTEAPATRPSAQPIATHTLTPVPPTATATHIPPTATQAPKPTRTPPRAVHYTVKPGDNLTHIATRFGTTVDAIERANYLPSTVIYAGQVLTIPGR